MRYLCKSHEAYTFCAQQIRIVLRIYSASKEVRRGRLRPHMHNDGLPSVVTEQQYWNTQKTVAKMTCPLQTRIRAPASCAGASQRGELIFNELGFQILGITKDGLPDHTLRKLQRILS